MRVGSKGGKPRKPEQHHLPKVGSPANREYEYRERRREVFGGWPTFVVALFVLVIVVGFVVVTV